MVCILLIFLAANVAYGSKVEMPVFIFGSDGILRSLGGVRRWCGTATLAKDTQVRNSRNIHKDVDDAVFVVTKALDIILKLKEIVYPKLFSRNYGWNKMFWKKRIEFGIYSFGKSTFVQMMRKPDMIHFLNCCHENTHLPFFKIYTIANTLCTELNRIF